MERRDILKLTGGIGAASTLGLGSIGAASAAQNGEESSGERGGSYGGNLTLASPDLGGFTKTLMYVAEGVTTGEWDRIQRGDFFQREVMDRSPEEVDAQDQEAAAFFQEKFGLAFDGEDLGDGTVERIDGDGEGEGAILHRFMQDPETEYRAYLVSGEGVYQSGALVRDGGYFVTLEEEMALGGTFGDDETTYPAGTFLVFGDYNIDPARIRGRSEPIVIHYESGSPIVPGPNPFAFSCVLTHPDWGEGKANGTVIPGGAVDGGQSQHIRNVLTFPAQLN
jgi:hypothetical protein